MEALNISGLNICGIAACTPKEKFEISQYEYFTESEKNDFTKYVGVKSKRYSDGTYTTTDLCFNAAKKLIQDLAWSPSDIELLILVTQTPDYTVPASSIILQHRLGLSKTAIVFDINMGCSGWVYILLIAGGLMNSMKFKKALLLAGETSIIANYKDKSTFPLMGDAGTATALELQGKNLMTFNVSTDGSGHNAIMATNSGARFKSKLNHKDFYSHDVSLNGQLVLEFCLREVFPSVKSILKSAGVVVSDIDYFVFHQGNRIINESLRKKLDISPEKFPYSIKEFGNTSSASIPLTIVTQLAEQIRKKKLTLLCSGFGVGLSWANVLLQTNLIVCPELIEI